MRLEKYKNFWDITNKCYVGKIFIHGNYGYYDADKGFIRKNTYLINCHRYTL